MAKPNRSPRNSADLAPVRLPAAAIIAQDKGGEAKSLTALALADRARISGVPIRVVQVDDQGRLPKMLGPEVVKIRIDPRAARHLAQGPQPRAARLHAALPLARTRRG